MPRRLVSTARFRRSCARLEAQDLALVEGALTQLEEYLQTGRASVGLGLKKLAPGVFEVRVGLALRIVYVLDEHQVVLALLGHHDDVRRFLRRQ